MFTPSRYLIYAEHIKGVPNDLDNVSKITESMNYFNISHLSSRDPAKCRRDSSHIHIQMDSISSRHQGDNSPHFGDENQGRLDLHFPLSNVKKEYSNSSVGDLGTSIRKL